METFDVDNLESPLEGFPEEELEIVSRTILGSALDFIDSEEYDDGGESNVEVFTLPSAVSPVGSSIFGDENNKWTTEKALNAIVYMRGQEDFMFYYTYPAVLGLLRNVDQYDMFHAIGRVGVEFTYPEEEFNDIIEREAFEEIDPLKVSADFYSFETIFPETAEEEEEFTEELNKLCTELKGFLNFGGDTELFQEYLEKYPGYCLAKMQGFANIQYNLKILSEIYRMEEEKEGNEEVKYRLVEDLIDLASSARIPLYNKDKFEFELMEWPSFVEIFYRLQFEQLQGVIGKQKLLDRIRFVNEWVSDYEDFFEKEFLREMVERLEAEEEGNLDEVDLDYIQKLKDMKLWEEEEVVFEEEED